MKTLHNHRDLFADAQRIAVADMEEWLRVTRAAITNGRPAEDIARRARRYLQYLRIVCEHEEIATEYDWTDQLFQPRLPVPFRPDRHWIEKGLQWTPF